MKSDHHNKTMAACALQKKLEKRHISIIKEKLVANNFGQRTLWMVTQVADDCSASWKLGVSTLKGKSGFPLGQKIGVSSWHETWGFQHT